MESTFSRGSSAKGLVFTSLYFQIEGLLYYLLLQCIYIGLAGARAFRYSFYFGFGSGPIHMTSVRCTGTETRLVNCRYSTDPFDLYFFCGHFYDAGVRCQRGVEIDSVVQYSKFNNIITVDVQHIIISGPFTA